MMNEKYELMRAAALAATPGPWFYQHDADVYTHIIRAESESNLILQQYSQDPSGKVKNNAIFTATANPDAVLSLLSDLTAQDKRIADLVAAKAELQASHEQLVNAAAEMLTVMQEAKAEELKQGLADAFKNTLAAYTVGFGIIHAAAIARAEGGE